MKAQATRIFILALALILIAASLGPVGGTIAQAKPAATGENTPSRSPDAPSVTITPTISYQGKLVEDGTPVTGTRSMTFRLWDSPMGGSWYWEEKQDVQISNGLFTVTLGEKNAFNTSIFKMHLYLEINVAGTVLPRQLLQGAPYALSLAPGAEMSGDQSTSLLYAKNGGGGQGIIGESGWGSGIEGYSFSGHGAYVESWGSGINGATLQAKNMNTDGIALVAQNNSTSDTTLLVENNGTGDLIKGFGGDGYEDEIRFKNDGTFQDKAPSYVFISGTEADACLFSTLIFERWASDVKIFGTSLGISSVCITAGLPAILYGQSVKIKEIRIYYLTEGSQNYITETLVKAVGDGNYQPTMFDDTTDYNSNNAYAYYDIIPAQYATMNSDRGRISIIFDIDFKDLSQSITITAIRLKLSHHPLY